MRQNSSVGTVLYFVLSTAFHGGMAYALVSVAQMQMGAEGHSETIEFVAATTGGRGSFAPAAPEPALSLPEPTPAQPTEEVVKEKAPTPKPAQKAKAKTKPAPVTELPQKVFVEEEPTNEESVTVVAQPVVETPAVVENPTSEDLEEPVIATEETLTENDVMAKEETLETAVDETTQETLEPEVVVVPLSESAQEAQKPTDKATDETATDSQDLEGGSELTPQILDSPVEANHSGHNARSVVGPADGQGIRSYTELRQVPGNKPPRYPTLARRQNHQGQVQLSYYVQKDGRISDLKVVKSSGYPTLDQEAVRAVSLFQYQAGQEGWTMHPVDFQLQGPVKKTPSRLRTSSRDPKNF